MLDFFETFGEGGVIFVLFLFFIGMIGIMV